MALELALVAEGLSNQEIAERLVVSPCTAKTHVSRAMVKLGARDRAQLVAFAYESGLARPGWLDQQKVPRRILFSAFANYRLVVYEPVRLSVALGR